MSFLGESKCPGQHTSLATMGEDVSHVVLAQAIYGKPVDDTMVITTSLDQKSTPN